MQQFTTESEEEWYILTPVNIGGSITNGGEKVHYKDGLTIETFDNKVDYENRCVELGIELNEE